MVPATWTRVKYTYYASGIYQVTYANEQSCKKTEPDCPGASFLHAPGIQAPKDASACGSIDGEPALCVKRAQYEPGLWMVAVFVPTRGFYTLTTSRATRPEHDAAMVQVLENIKWSA